MAIVIINGNQQTHVKKVALEPMELSLSSPSVPLSVTVTSVTTSTAVAPSSETTVSKTEKSEKKS